MHKVERYRTSTANQPGRANRAIEVVGYALFIAGIVGLVTTTLVHDSSGWLLPLAMAMCVLLGVLIAKSLRTLFLDLLFTIFQW